jgi:adhesin transport system outer membrane protein
MRRLVALADDNVSEHRKALQKIDSRVKAGVGRGVDLEQAQARLALAESNMITERANLHDVVARYQRVVGEAPQRVVPPLAPLDAQLPANAVSALQKAVEQHPSIRASVASMRAAEFAVKTRQSLLQPRVELRARTGRGNNYNGLEGRRGDSGAEVVMNWNLFDGGADRARVRAQAALLGQASDLRDKACRDVTQVAAIAVNDVAKLSDQITLLQSNTDAIERARQAYRQQFDISQRSLLDLLNAENEAYTAQRALANAQFDRVLATARTHAALGQLTQQLGLSRSHQDDDAQAWQAGDSAPARCPALPPALDALL